MNADGYKIDDAPMDEDACMADRDLMGLDSALEEPMDENCGECDGDELTQEDIVLPAQSPSEDFMDEVTKKTVDGPEGEQHPDDEYINRLQSLAGVRGRGF
jgi:hypothetical protein